MWDWIGKLDELRRSNQLAVLVTVTKSNGSTPRKSGAKMIVLPDGTFYGTVGGGTPEFYALEDARLCFDTMQSTSTNVPLKQRGEFPACGGTMEFYMELINDNPVLYLFGAGHRPVPLPGPRRHPLPHSSRRRAGRVDKCPDPPRQRYPSPVPLQRVHRQGQLVRQADLRYHPDLQRHPGSAGAGRGAATSRPLCGHGRQQIQMGRGQEKPGGKGAGPVQRALSHRP